MNTKAEEIRATFPVRDAVIVASVSGGKDSTAMCLWLTENGIEHRRVFADTGWEAPETYAYLDVLRSRLGPIDVVRNDKLWDKAPTGEGGMLELIRRKKTFPRRMLRFCTEQLKVIPIKNYIETIKDYNVINAVGIRAAESKARATLSEWEWNGYFDCHTWRPLLTWSEQDVINIHHRHSLAPNPLYLKTARRVGCYPCIFASKAEIAAVPEWRVQQIATIERELTDDAVARGVEKPGRSFFHSHSGGGFVPIERVREWSRTARGGAQMLLLDAADPGCMRWGLCDTSNE